MLHHWPATASQCLFLSSLSRTLFTWQSPLHCFYLSAHFFSLSDDVLNRAGCIVLLFHAHLVHYGELVCGLVLVVFHFSEGGGALVSPEASWNVSS